MRFVCWFGFGDISMNLWRRERKNNISMCDIRGRMYNVVIIEYIFYMCVRNWK